MVDKIHYRWDFIGLSTDSKPTPAESPKVVDGSTFYESNTSKLYVFYKDTWYEKTATGGGGTSYTAGEGIDITNDEISVDTETIQPKLTAGTNITIDEDNVISAEGGGGATVVQTTGTSTTDVMSQNATTSMVFSDPADKKRVAIGNGASNNSHDDTIAIGTSTEVGFGAYSGIAIGNRAKAKGSQTICVGQDSTSNSLGGIAIGKDAKTQQGHSIALGEGAVTSRAGELNIGTGTTTNGYNSTSYRVIGGVYDGQSAHDAVTVSQVNSVIDAINTALSTSIPHIGA